VAVAAPEDGAEAGEAAVGVEAGCADSSGRRGAPSSLTPKNISPYLNTSD
jgi:hypothetical protein